MEEGKERSRERVRGSKEEMEGGKERDREKEGGRKKKMEGWRKLLIYYNYIAIFTTARE